MIGPSALSVAARELRARLAAALDLTPAQVLVGPPAAAVKEAQREPRTLLNLFIHRVEAAGQADDATPADPLLVRAHALITAFAEPETDAQSQVTVGAGEVDLRLIGGVVQALHAQPVLRLHDAAGDEVAQLQVLLAPLGLDEINHLWSTQGDAPYRLSVACELALLPLPLARRIERGPKVGALGLQVAAIGAGFEHAAALGFAAPPVQVDGERPDWAPAIRFVGADGRLQLALALARDALPAEPSLALAGVVGSEVTLVWERWDRSSGWQAVADSGAPPLHIEQAALADGAAIVHRVALPLAAPGQALLHATRTWRHADGSLRSARSNPLLVSVHDA